MTCSPATASRRDRRVARRRSPPASKPGWVPRANVKLEAEARAITRPWEVPLFPTPPPPKSVVKGTRPYTPVTKEERQQAAKQLLAAQRLYRRDVVTGALSPPSRRRAATTASPRQRAQMRQAG